MIKQNFLMNALLKCLSFFWKKPKETAAPEKKKVRKQHRQVKKTISKTLDSLDQTFELMKKLKPKKSDYSILARNHGAIVIETLPQDDGFNKTKVTEHKAYGFPSILSMFSRGWEEDGDPFPYFCVMTKTQDDHKVVYDGVYVFSFEGEACELAFSVSVDPETGLVTPLPVICYKTIMIPYRQSKSFSGKKNRKGRLGYSSQVVPCMDIPDLRPENSEETKEQHIQELFCLLFNITMTGELYTNVVAENSDGKAIFFVNDLEAKDFFKERIPVTVNDKQKRIYHSVTSHYRNYGDKKVAIKTHYRGVRDFKWKGYDVSIRMPGKHYMQNALFNITTGAERGKTIGVSKVLKMLDRVRAIA